MSRFSWLLLLACSLAVALSPSPSAAQDADAYRHDGFLLRVTTGLGELFGSVGPPETEASVGRMASLACFDLGGAPVDDLIVSAVFTSLGAIGDGLASTDELPSEASIHGLGLGVGVSYYFMPYNVYARAEATFRTARIGFEGACDRTISLFSTPDTCEFSGFGLGVGAGKEWWVSENWGLGVAAQFDYISLELDEDGYDPTPMTLYSLGLSFSATYN